MARKRRKQPKMMTTGASQLTSTRLSTAAPLFSMNVFKLILLILRIYPHQCADDVLRINAYPARQAEMSQRQIYFHSMAASRCRLNLMESYKNTAPVGSSITQPINRTNTATESACTSVMPASMKTKT